jgi:hypothetical protein
MAKVSCYIGLDVAFAKGKHLPVVICTWNGDCLVPLPLRQLQFTPPQGKGNLATFNCELVSRFAEDAARYIVQVCNELGLIPTRIGIDAPSSPKKDDVARRLCEKGLDQAGISCFATPSADEFDVIREKARKHLASGGAVSKLPHANQLWMIVGFALFERLSQLAPCLEVFPQAIVRAIDAGDIHKSHLGAVETQLMAAAQFTGWPTSRDTLKLDDIAWGDKHDKLDAYLSAWVASLEESNRIPYGEPPDDAIWIPKTNHGLKVKYAAGSTDGNPKIQATQAVKPSTPAYKILCPGCGKFEFKHWPLGWDAHAAHKCAGVKAIDPKERKAEYRRKYLTD